MSRRLGHVAQHLRGEHPVAARLHPYYANGRRWGVEVAESDRGAFRADRSQAARSDAPLRSRVVIGASFFASLARTTVTGESPRFWSAKGQTLRPANQAIGFDAFPGIEPLKAATVRDIGRRRQLWTDSRAGLGDAGAVAGTLRRAQLRFGRVASVGPGVFQAVMANLVPPADEELVEFNLEQVAPDDRDRIVPGTRFYWLLGFVDAPDHGRMSVSLLQLRREQLEWTEDQRHAARGRAAETMRLLGLA